MTDILETARANFKRALAETQGVTLPDAGGRWGAYCSHVRVLIDRFQTPQEVINYLQSPQTQDYAGFESRQSGQALIDHASSMEGFNEREFPEFAHAITSFVETPLAHPETTTRLRGRLISAPLMFHMLTVMRCTRHCRPKRVLEIGGGYGAPGRIWMTNGLHRPERYIDVDFPESLFYAEVYLRATMPNCSLTYVHAGDRLPPSSETQFVLCPIPHMDVAFQAPNDLLINTGSMQEMTDDYVAFYMRVIEWSPCNMFYSCNYFGQPIDSARQESMNIGAPVMAKTWKTAYRRFGGGKEGGTAECFFVRVGEEDCIPAAEAALRKPPADAAGFLDVFDAVRRTGAIS